MVPRQGPRNRFQARLQAGTRLAGTGSQATFPGRVGFHSKFPGTNFSPTAQALGLQPSQEQDVQSIFPGTGSQARLPGRIPKPGSQEQVPRQSSQARVPETVAKQGSQEQVLFGWFKRNFSPEKSV